MPTQILLKIITILVFAVVVAVPLFYFKQGIYPFLFDKALFFQALVEVLFGLWLAFVINRMGLIGLIRRISHIRRISPILLALALFIAALVLTAFTGVDAWRSFFSTYERAYGVFGVMHMAAFAVVLASLRRELPWRWVFAASIVTSAIIAVLAGLEFYYNNNLLLEQPRTRAGATFGNPSFLAAYLSWNIFIALYFLLASVTSNQKENASFRVAGEESRDSSGVLRSSLRTTLWSRLRTTSGFNKNRLSKFLFSAPWLLFVIFLDAAALIFVTQTRGQILGLAVGIFVLLVLFAIRPPALNKNPKSQIPNPKQIQNSNNQNPNFLRKRMSGLLGSRTFYAALVLTIVLAGSVFWVTRASDFWTKIPGIERFREISFEAESLQPRLIALRAAWRGFLERPVFGWGPENFNIVFNKYYDPKALRANYQETRFDKPHNFVAEDLVTGGVVLTLAHLLFLGAFVFAAWRFGDKLFGQTVVAALASYFVGNLFIFSTIGSDLLLFVLAGFLAGPLSHEITNQSESTNTNSYIRKNSPIRAIKPGVLFVALAISLVFAYLVNINTMRASNYLFHGFFDLAGGKVEQGVGGFRKTLSIWSPWRWNFARDFAAAMSDFYFYNPELAKKEDVLEAIKWMEYARDKHPLDAYNHYALVDMYNQVSDIDPEKFLPAAEREAKIALELSPNRQQVYFSLAKTKTLQGDYPKAIELAKYGLSLDDKVADGHFYYGLLLLAHGDTETGYAELKQAIRLGRKWKNFYEPLTIGNLLADAGRIEDAIELYAISVVMSGGANQLEAKTKLGLAFYFAGRKDEAKSELQYVAKRFDFKTSPEFAKLKPILDDLGVVY